MERPEETPSSSGGMNSVVADRKLAWTLPATASVVVVLTMAPFPVCEGLWHRYRFSLAHRWAYAMINTILPPRPEATDSEKQKVLSELVSFAGELIPQIQRPEINE